MFTFRRRLIEAENGDFIEYTPVLSGGPCISGELSFASWQVEVGATASEHDNAKHKALDNALRVLGGIVARGGQF